MVIICFILGFVIILLFVYKLCSVQNDVIRRVFELKKLASDVETGARPLCYVTDSELLSLISPLFSHVGFGGIGPCYVPSFSLWFTVTNELSRRRRSRVLR